MKPHPVELERSFSLGRLLDSLGENLGLARGANRFGILILTLAVVLSPAFISQLKTYDKRLENSRRANSVELLRSAFADFRDFHKSLGHRKWNPKALDVIRDAATLRDTLQIRKKLNGELRLLSEKANFARLQVQRDKGRKASAVFDSVYARSSSLEMLGQYDRELLWCCMLFQRVSGDTAKGFVLNAPLSMKEIAFSISLFNLRHWGATLPLEWRAPALAELDSFVVRDLRPNVRESTWVAKAGELRNDLREEKSSPELQAKTFGMPIVGVDFNPLLFYLIAPTLFMGLLAYTSAVLMNVSEVTEGIQRIDNDPLKHYVSPWPEGLRGMGWQGGMFSYASVITGFISFIFAVLWCVKTQSYGSFTGIASVVILLQTIVNWIWVLRLRTQFTASLIDILEKE